MWVTFMEGESA